MSSVEPEQNPEGDSPPAAAPEAHGDEASQSEVLPPGLTADQVKHGVYYVLPDSGESFNASLWERVDRSALEGAWSQMMRDATADLDDTDRGHPDVLGGSVFYTPRAERQLLSEVGGEKTKAALALFEELDRQSGWKMITSAAIEQSPASAADGSR